MKKLQITIKIHRGCFKDLVGLTLHFMKAPLKNLNIAQITHQNNSSPLSLPFPPCLSNYIERVSHHSNEYVDQKDCGKYHVEHK